MIEINKIYKEDCLTGMLRLDDKSVDLILCDLPYGFSTAHWDNMLPVDILWTHYKRIIKDNGCIVLNSIQPFTSKLIMSNLEWFKEELIWQKDRASNFANANHRHLKYHENIIVFAKNTFTYNKQMQPRDCPRVKQGQQNNYMEKRKVIRKDNSEVILHSDFESRSFDVYNANEKNPSTIIYNPIVVSNSHEKFDHPTQKPIKLLEYLIKTYSNEGELVLDNTCGSGSTIIAAINTKRSYIGFELDEKYFNLAQKRIKTHKIENDLDITDGLF